LQCAGNFYINIVGLETIPEPVHDGKHIWFDIGGGTHLHQIKEPPQKKNITQKTTYVYPQPIFQHLPKS